MRSFPIHSPVIVAMHSSPTYSITNLLADIVIASIGTAIEIIPINSKAVEEITIIKR
jgi:hypothetical protein